MAAPGGPLGALIAGARVHAIKRLAAPLEASVVDRPPPTAERPPHRCRAQGDDHPTGHETVTATQDTPHSRRSAEEPREPAGEKTSPARRWVVERPLAWRSKGRGLLVR